MNEIIKHHFEKHGALFDFLNNQDTSALEAAARAVASTFLNGGKLYLCGCGISEYMAEYAAALFLQHPEGKRPPYPAVALSGRFYLAGAAPEEVFEKQVMALANSGDTVFSFATSGSCERIMNALRAASRSGVGTISMAGADCALFRGISDIFIPVEHVDPLRVQEAHMLMVHALCAMVDKLILEP
jgi:D-sedoheptulose 7-phosphate isomerase